jgi:hypothetical protein
MVFEKIKILDLMILMGAIQLLGPSRHFWEDGTRFARGHFRAHKNLDF